MTGRAFESFGGESIAAVDSTQHFTHFPEDLKTTGREATSGRPISGTGHFSATQLRLTFSEEQSKLHTHLIPQCGAGVK
ncbi:hypothetical protein NECAME_11755 [Necator americanus]|uniref:Uncharacterized protein n=1 Tax=Necator americanus TaxID=51031 RepID=W2T2T0_NECAM|nr:hypothetical protein NECAME_11755 [Necator americanus]ETN76300.1 hypothetical protein NECAME_11755 [Necator americanus]